MRKRLDELSERLDKELPRSAEPVLPPRNAPLPSARDPEWIYDARLAPGEVLEEQLARAKEKRFDRIALAVSASDVSGPHVLLRQPPRDPKGVTVIPAGDYQPLAELLARHPELAFDLNIESLSSSPSYQIMSLRPVVDAIPSARMKDTRCWLSDGSSVTRLLASVKGLTTGCSCGPNHATRFGASFVVSFHRDLDAAAIVAAHARGLRLLADMRYAPLKEILDLMTRLGSERPDGVITRERSSL